MSKEEDEKFINLVLSSLPKTDFLSSKDLIALGISSSEATLSQWRCQGIGPPSRKIAQGKIRYMKDELISWLKKINNIKE